MAWVFKGDNPSSLYLQALGMVLLGDELAPRGKKIKEIRPVVFEFTEPTRRVTFVGGRVINPFFQLAESLWIILGKGDVSSITPYNKSIGQFSDDGEYFNAPYGERLRYWNKNIMRGFIFNPIDQLKDVYTKIMLDPDTRQAVSIIYNPLFDNSKMNTKDTPCNLVLDFKLRKGKLDLTVFNRSNDLHWGLFGANLVQFSTILEMMAGWLRVEVGTYTHITNSLHVYLEDYGCGISDQIKQAHMPDSVDYSSIENYFYHYSPTEEPKFVEPRIGKGMDPFLKDLDLIAEEWDFIRDLTIPYPKPKVVSKFARFSYNIVRQINDPYLQMILLAMGAYQAHNMGDPKWVTCFLTGMPDCSWKVSCLRFLSQKYDLKELYQDYPQKVIDYIERKDMVSKA